MKNKKIFGLGLPKTGTTSLSKYLNHIGVNTIHDDITFYFNKGNIESVKNLGIYDAFIGSLCVCRLEIIEKFTESKFIITNRDKTTWLDSAKVWFSRAGNSNVRVDLFGTPLWDEKKFSKVYDSYLTDLVKSLEKNNCDYIIIDIINDDNVTKQICNFLDVDHNSDMPHLNIKK